MGMAVLEVIRDEHMLDGSTSVGKVLVSEMNRLKTKHCNIGDVRGMGLSMVLEIVDDQVRCMSADLSTGFAGLHPYRQKPFIAFFCNWCSRKFHNVYF